MTPPWLLRPGRVTCPCARMSPNEEAARVRCARTNAVRGETKLLIALERSGLTHSYEMRSLNWARRSSLSGGTGAPLGWGGAGASKTPGTGAAQRMDGGGVASARAELESTSSSSASASHSLKTFSTISRGVVPRACGGGSRGSLRGGTFLAELLGETEEGGGGGA